MSRTVVALVALVFSVWVQASARVIVATTEAPRGSLHVVALEKLGELVVPYSDGRLVMENHYIGNPDFPEIRGEEVNVNMVMSGAKPADADTAIDMTIVATGNASRQAEFLDFLMLPYVFDSEQSAETLFHHAYMTDTLNSMLAAEFNVRAIGWLVGGFRHLSNSRRPVRSLDDIRGLKIRVPMNRIMRETYFSFGAKAVPIPWGETFDALKQGRVDGQENPYSVMVEAAFWDAGQRYVTSNGPFLYSAPILVNETFFQSLPPREQQALMRAGSEAAAYANAWNREEIERFKNILVEHGVVIDSLYDKSYWKAASRPVWASNYANTDSKKAILAEVLRILGE